ncbi:hypothetical protein MNEG_3610, partial [Monoraphidium neglectum]
RQRRQLAHLLPAAREELQMEVQRAAAERERAEQWEPFRRQSSSSHAAAAAAGAAGGRGRLRRGAGKVGVNGPEEDGNDKGRVRRQQQQEELWAGLQEIGEDPDAAIDEDERLAWVVEMGEGPHEWEEGQNIQGEGGESRLGEPHEHEQCAIGGGTAASTGGGR